MLARTPIAAQCAVKDVACDRVSNWIDISITGPSRAAVEAAISDYRMEHAACEPKPAFYYIQGNEAEGFRVGGSRGRDPSK